MTDIENLKTLKIYPFKEYVKSQARRRMMIKKDENMHW